LPVSSQPSNTLYFTHLTQLLKYLLYFPVSGSPLPTVLSSAEVLSSADGGFWERGWG